LDVHYQALNPEPSPSTPHRTPYWRRTFGTDRDQKAIRGNRLEPHGVLLCVTPSLEQMSLGDRKLHLDTWGNTWQSDRRRTHAFPSSYLPRYGGQWSTSQGDASILRIVKWIQEASCPRKAHRVRRRTFQGTYTNATFAMGYRRSDMCAGILRKETDIRSRGARG